MCCRSVTINSAILLTVVIAQSSNSRCAVDQLLLTTKKLYISAYLILKSDWSGTWLLLPIDAMCRGFYCVRRLHRLGTGAEPFDCSHARESLIRLSTVSARRG